MYRQRLILLLLILAPFRVNGQSYYFTHYQVENGLSNNAVICSLQDRQGFLWFGTKDGLNRFDGYSFKVFRNDADDPKSIGSNFIYCLHEDPKGGLWVGCDRGLFRYEAATESFRRITAAPPHEIMDIQTDGSGNCWFISRMNLYRYNEAKAELKNYRSKLNMDVTSVCASPDGTLWVSAATGNILRFVPATDTFKRYPVLNSASPDVSKWIEKLYCINDDQLLIGTTKQGAKIFDVRTAACTDMLASKTDIFVRDFVERKPGEYWVATESGIFIYTAKDRQIIQLKKDYSNPYSLSDNAVYTFCKDREGGIWAGTYFGGLNYYPEQYTSFRKYFPQYGSNSILGNAVREVCQDHAGNLWIGTEDAGLNKMDGKTGAFSHFSGITHSNVHGLLIHGNELWVGTFHHGLDVLDVHTGKLLRHYSASTHALKSDFIYCMLKTRSGKIIAGTDRGLFNYNADKDDFTLETAVPPTFYTMLYEDRQGIIWAGTYSEGVYYFNPHTGQAGSFRYDAANKYSLGGNRVNWIMEDNSGTLWIAAEGGLCKLEKDRQHFLRYTTASGFPSNMLFAIMEDAEKNLWISTSRGLVCFSPNTGHIKVYTKANGLLSDQFNYNSAYRDSSGRMYFGSAKGLISFHPGEFAKDTFLPPVYITGFQVYDKELGINENGSPLKSAITLTHEMTLHYNQSSFSIDFAALSYTAPATTGYAYKMEGLDKDWTYLTSNRKAYFTELSPGNYTFKVKASNSSGIWNEHPAVLTIHILPPFWASVWAYLLYTALVITAIFCLIRNYHRRTEEKNKRNLELLEHEKEREIYHAKIEFFTNVAHEIRTPLTLIKGPMEKIIRNADEVPAIKRNLLIMQKNTDRLLDLTSQLLDFRKTEIKGFSLNFVKADVAKILEDNYLQFKPAAEQKKLRFRITAPPYLFAYVDIEALHKIISNLLNNAVKYAESKVTLNLPPIAADDTVFTIEVRNDGLLIPYEMKEKIFETFFRMKEMEKQSGTGIGLALSRSLAELHKGALFLKPPENNLNVFVLVLPIHQEIEFNLQKNAL